MSERNYTSKEVLLMTKIRKSNTKCYYCGCNVLENNRTVDHLQPVSRGGLTVESNLVMACKECNNEKDFLTEEEYKIFLGIANKEIEQSISVKHLNSLLGVYSSILENMNTEQHELKETEKEIVSIEDTIRDSRLSASDGYILCKSLQDSLIKKENLKKNVSDLQRINRDMMINYNATREKLNHVKSKIRSSCKKQYIDSKKITLE